ncbi:hypothetical protein [Pararhodospirillum photometricum]|uniref:hypothetical protein n=1 Tax=Pararhodospirillum photometricum TaxID=1084 RepID=UPI000313BC89|nr:hypothetical protein [Pararhodospirillum photometricum]
MKRLILVDLDDTLFQTRRKNPGATRVAALDATGAPRSFQSDSQAALWAWLHEGARVIPVTGRAVSALRRVRLPLGPEAVCSFGGVILGPDGTPDPAWHAALAPAAAEHAPRLEALAAELPPLAAQHNAKIRHRSLRFIADSGVGQTGESLRARRVQGPGNG